MEIYPDFKELRDSVRRFTERELEPWALEIDRTGAVPAGAIETLRAGGYLGMRMPEDMAAAPRASRILPGARGVQPQPSDLHHHRRRHQRSHAGRDPAPRHRRAAPALSARPGQRHLARRLRLDRAEGPGPTPRRSARGVEPRGNGWVINGRKHYISGADVADVIMVMAVNDPAKRARGGITALLVDRGTPGLTVTRVDTTIGSEAIKLAS
ncbi:MAG: acyl-CoA dehydrogenase family protein [Pseudomonadota bacterium]